MTLLKKLALQSLSFALAGLIVLSTVSCRPSVELDDPADYFALGNEIDFPRVFKTYWDAMNNKYMFWDIDPTDWDAVYNAYSPKFAALGLVKDIPENEALIREKGLQAYEYFKEMSANLVDGHYTVFFETPWGTLLGDGTAISRIRPTPKKNNGGDDRNGTFRMYTREQQTEFLPAIKKYLGTGTGAPDDYTLDSIPQPDGSIFTSGWGKIPVSGGHVVYFYFNAFLLGANQDATVLQTFFDALLDPDLKGVIVDIRGNGGGAGLDLSLLWGCFIKEPHTFAYTKGKAGDGRLDYTAYIPFQIFPAPEDFRAKDNIKIALLVDRFSVSCSEVSAMIVKTMPGRENHKIFGETTWGGTSPLTRSSTGYIMYDGGSTIPVEPVFWSEIFTPYYAVKCADGNVYEGIGIPPDEPIASDDAYWTAFEAGQDKRLEAAIKWIDPSY